MSSILARNVSRDLKSAESRLAELKVVVGLDGFVDTILHVVARRDSAKKFARMEKMGDFAARIAAAAGLSANFEFVTQMVKLGGNGPIMANALCSYGLPVTYIGNLGAPNVHPVFAELAARATVHSIAEPGCTDAIEFEDGKLMCGKHESLKDVNWANLIAQVPEAKLLALFRQASLIALVNWTMLTQMGAIWQKIGTRIAPQLKGDRRWLFIDLADPAKRSCEDIKLALKQVAKFEKHFRVIFGMNLQESRQVGEVLGFAPPEETYGAVTHHASLIQEALKVHTVVIHPTQFAAAASGGSAAHVVGPFTVQPKITTGAGDHFNAGFCVGRMLALDLEASLQLGVATSGFYVRHAKSPSVANLRKFLAKL